MVARDFDKARATAKAADAATMRGDTLPPLHGLPIGIKDLLMTEGLVSTQGSLLLKDNVPAKDDNLVARLRRAGANVIGKTNTPEFGAGANTRNAVYGATGNPFDPAKSCAGSSGGSAVALATGMAPICQGSDTGGSLRNPAAFCGIVGFRPTPGMVPAGARGVGWSGLPVLGPMARTVADTALLLSAMASDDACDPLATTIHGKTVREPGDVYPLQPVDLSGLRVAVTPDFGFAPTERHISEVFAEKVGLFRHVLRRRPRTRHPTAPAPMRRSRSCAPPSSSAPTPRRCGHPPTRSGPMSERTWRKGCATAPQDVARAMMAQTAIYRRWQTFFERFDVILTPAITISPRSWRELYPAEIDGQPTRTYFHWLAMAYAVTIVGHPAVSLPVGVDR